MQKRAVLNGSFLFLWGILGVLWGIEITFGKKLSLFGELTLCL
jgi:hypothetical protein